MNHTNTIKYLAIGSVSPEGRKTLLEKVTCESNIFNTEYSHNIKQIVDNIHKCNGNFDKDFIIKIVKRFSIHRLKIYIITQDGITYVFMAYLALNFKDANDLMTNFIISYGNGMTFESICNSLALQYNQVDVSNITVIVDGKVQNGQIGVVPSVVIEVDKNVQDNQVGVPNVVIEVDKNVQNDQVSVASNVVIEVDEKAKNYQVGVASNVVITVDEKAVDNFETFNPSVVNKVTQKVTFANQPIKQSLKDRQKVTLKPALKQLLKDSPKLPLKSSLKLSLNLPLKTIAKLPSNRPLNDIPEYPPNMCNHKFKFKLLIVILVWIIIIALILVLIGIYIY